MGWVGGYEGSSPSLSLRPSPAVVGSSRCCRGLAGLVKATKRERPWMPDVLPSSRGSGLRLPSTAFVTPGGAPLASESAGFRRATRGVPPPVASSSSGGCVVRGVRGGSAVVPWLCCSSSVQPFAVAGSAVIPGLAGSLFAFSLCRVLPSELEGSRGWRRRSALCPSKTKRKLSG